MRLQVLEILLPSKTGKPNTREETIVFAFISPEKIAEFDAAYLAFIEQGEIRRAEEVMEAARSYVESIQQRQRETS